MAVNRGEIDKIERLCYPLWIPALSVVMDTLRPYDALSGEL